LIHYLERDRWHGHGPLTLASETDLARSNHACTARQSEQVDAVSSPHEIAWVGCIVWPDALLG